MAAGTVLSGKDGYIVNTSGPETFHHISNWRLRRTAITHAVATNSTGGFKTRITGVRDVDGRFTGHLHDGEVMPIVEGGVYTLELHVDDTGNNYYTCPVVIETIEQEVDIDSGEEQSYTASFSGTGAYTRNGTVT